MEKHLRKGKERQRWLEHLGRKACYSLRLGVGGQGGKRVSGARKALISQMTNTGSLKAVGSTVLEYGGRIRGIATNN